MHNMMRSTGSPKEFQGQITEIDVSCCLTDRQVGSEVNWPVRPGRPQAHKGSHILTQKGEKAMRIVLQKLLVIYYTSSYSCLYSIIRSLIVVTTLLNPFAVGRPYVSRNERF